MVHQQLRRRQIRSFFTKLSPSFVGINARSCCWFRELTALGHKVRLIPAPYVQPYVTGQQNNAADAAAIPEASAQPNVHHVPSKAQVRQTCPILHKSISELLSQIAVSNTICVPVAELCIVSAVGYKRIEDLIAIACNSEDTLISMALRNCAGALPKRSFESKEETLECDCWIIAKHSPNKNSLRLGALLGVGPGPVTAPIPNLADSKVFWSGCDFSTLESVPKQNSSREKNLVPSPSRGITISAPYLHHQAGQSPSLHLVHRGCAGRKPAREFGQRMHPRHAIDNRTSWPTESALLQKLLFPNEAEPAKQLYEEADQNSFSDNVHDVHNVHDTTPSNRANGDRVRFKL